MSPSSKTIPWAASSGCKRLLLPKAPIKKWRETWVFDSSILKPRESHTREKNIHSRNLTVKQATLGQCTPRHHPQLREDVSGSETPKQRKRDSPKMKKRDFCSNPWIQKLSRIHSYQMGYQGFTGKFSRRWMDHSIHLRGGVLIMSPNIFGGIGWNDPTWIASPCFHL